MDFPHPRKARPAGEQKADYLSLVASATARQATSRTVSAMLTTRSSSREGQDVIGSRIAFFGQPEKDPKRRTACGAFSVSQAEQFSRPAAKSITTVNLADSTKGKADAAEIGKPETQGAKWGTEL